MALKRSVATPCVTSSAYICAGEANFRIIDLKAAFTANTRKGIFTSLDRDRGNARLQTIWHDQGRRVPFEMVNPLKSTSGNNVIVLKGGYGYAKIASAAGRD